MNSSQKYLWTITKLVSIESCNFATAALFTVAVFRFATMESAANIVLMYLYNALFDSVVTLKIAQQFIRHDRASSRSRVQRLNRFFFAGLGSCLFSVFLVFFLMLSNLAERIELLSLLCFWGLSWVITFTTYAQQILGQHVRGSQIQLTWNLVSLLVLFISVNVGTFIDFDTIVFCRLIGVLAVLMVPFNYTILVALVSGIRRRFFKRFRVAFFGFNYRIHFLNMFSAICYAAPFLIVEQGMGILAFQAIAITKQLAETSFRLVPNAIISWSIDKISQRRPPSTGRWSFEIVFKYRFLGLHLLIGIMALTAYVLMPYCYIVLEKQYDGNALMHFLTILMCAFTVFNSFGANLAQALFQEKIAFIFVAVVAIFFLLTWSVSSFLPPIAVVTSCVLLSWSLTVLLLTLERKW